MEFFLTHSAFLSFLALFGVGGLGALFLERVLPRQEELAGRVAHAGALLGCLGLGYSAFLILISGQGLSFGFSSPLPLIEFSFRVDALGAFWLLLASLVGGAVSLYGFHYQKHFLGRRSLGWYGFLYSVFLASLLVLPLTNQAFFLLLVWELIVISAYFLVLYDQPENEEGAFLYFLLMQLGTVFIILGLFLAYSQIGSFSFDDWRTLSFNINPWFRASILLSLIIGLGIKAGIIPFHIWLPEVQSAPAPVSALFSGLMVTAAFFMLVRFLFDLLPGAEREWGLGLMTLGGFSTLLGILYALAEKDLKRLLAYSTVGHMGIMFLGLGAAIVFFSLGVESFALFALAASLYHAVNHAFFKTLLFLGAGTVVAATGTRNLDAYGGLIRVFPLTAGFFLVGALAISAFPPLNGFASVWLTFQALFVGVSSPDLLVKGIFTAAIVALVLATGLTAVTFVKAFGGTFLGRPRRSEPLPPHEAGFGTFLALGFLAFLIVGLGLGVTFVIATLIAVIASFGLTDQSLLHFPFLEFVAARDEFANILPLGQIAFLLAFVSVVTSFVVYRLTPKRRVTTGPAWHSGLSANQRMAMTPSGFSRSLVTIFRSILRPTEQKSIEYHDGRMRYFILRQTIQTSLPDVYRQGIYHPLHVALLFLARQAKHIQNGSVNLYILYIFLTLLGLLYFASRT